MKLGDITTQPARRIVRPLPRLIGSGFVPKTFGLAERFQVLPVITSGTLDHMNRTPPSRTPGLDVMYPRTNDDGSPSKDRAPVRFVTSKSGVFEVRPGTPVIAWSDGTVRRVEGSRRGRIVEVDHGAGFVTTYRHLAEVDVEVGQRVGASQTLGLVGVDPVEGFTPHLHTEGRLDGKLLSMDVFFNTAPAVEANTDIGLIPILSAAGIRGALQEAQRGRQTFVLIGFVLLLWWLSKRR